MYYKICYKEFMSPMFKSIIIQAESKEAVQKHFEKWAYIDSIYELDENKVDRIDLIIR